MYVINYHSQSVNATRIQNDLEFRVTGTSQKNLTDGAVVVSDLRIEVLKPIDGSNVQFVAFYNEATGGTSNFRCDKPLTVMEKVEILETCGSISTDIKAYFVDNTPLPLFV